MPRRRALGGKPGITRVASLAWLTLLACDGQGDPAQPTPCDAPTVWSTSATVGESNVISAFLIADIRDADSVTVRYGVSPSIDSTTPSVRPAGNSVGNSVVSPIYGLRPVSTYLAHLVAFNRCGASVGDVVSFTTGPLPADIPTYSTAGSTPSPGYVVIAAGAYGLVIDNAGRVVWYHRFPNSPGLNFQALPNGRYAARPPSLPGEEGTWVEVAPDGAVTRTYGCARGLQPRMHDVMALLDGTYIVMCDEVRTVDLSSQGGSATSEVIGTAIQRRSPAGTLLWEWSPFDHMDVELGVLEPADRTGPVINWTHGNAIDIDHFGYVYVSFRNLSEVVKLDPRTGGILWRFGGAHNTIRSRTGERPFARQHGLRVLGDTIILLDNLGHAGGSRAERYVDDEIAGVGLNASFRSPAGIVAQLGGTTQPLPNGRVLVSYGSGGGVEEYDAGGNVVWRLTGNPGYIFRAQRIRSLYAPGTGDPR